MDSQPLIAGLIGGLAATLSGRRETRLENFLVGALFTGFAAHRDPRSSTQSTVGIATAQGVAWGVADHAVSHGLQRLGVTGSQQGERT